MSQAAEIERARIRIRAVIALLEEIETAATEALNGIESALKEPLNELANLPSNPGLSACEHRRAHRPGRPAKLDTNPELRAFVQARIDRMTFVELAEEIARHFPPDQRVGKSVLHKWFHKNRLKSHPR